MGKATQELVDATNDISVVAGISRRDESVNFSLCKTIADCETESDCVISFLPPTAFDENMTLLDYCANKKLPVVICTTGLFKIIPQQQIAAAESLIVQMLLLICTTELFGIILPLFKAAVCKTGELSLCITVKFQVIPLIMAAE